MEITGLAIIEAVFSMALCSNGAAIGLWVLGGKYLEGVGRHPELMPMLRTQFFIMMGLVDAVPMIAVGVGLYALFAL